MGALDHTTFPRTDRQVSRLGFGAMGFAGWFGSQPEADHIRALHYALDQGVNFIDTARAYGESEAILGRGLKQWSGPPPFVATKVEGLAVGPQWSTVVPIDRSLPKGQVTASCEASLRALGLDVIDCLQLHAYWPTWGVEGYWLDELRALKETGKVRAIGISVPDHRSDMVLPIVISGVIDSVQTVINIFDPIALENLVPLCQKHDVAVIARCILDGGGLTGFLTPETTFPPGDFRHGYFDDTVPRASYIAKVDALRRYVPEHASSLAALAIKFALWHPGVTTAITSMHEQRYAAINIAASSEPRLPEPVYKALMFRHRFIKAFMDVRNFADLDAVPDQPLPLD
jgi:aryl-alcohol dehydrogenase-like predicted oxidoreductase